MKKWSFTHLLGALLLLVLIYPQVQKQTRWFPEAELKGAFVQAEPTIFSWDKWFSGDFQNQAEKYFNQQFGFRNGLIQLKNTIEYNVFGIIHADDLIEGKEGYMYSEANIDVLRGVWYSGKEKNNLAINQVKRFQNRLEEKGKHVLVILAPSKESVLPQYVPEGYALQAKPDNDYNDFVTGFQKEGIHFIDFNPYFKTIQDTSTYGLFTKTGFHWSYYGAAIAQDCVLNYMSEVQGFKFPELNRVGVELLDTARGLDDDFEGPMNLLHNINRGKYAYVQYRAPESHEKAKKPKVISINDSFFNTIKDLDQCRYVWREDSKAWYYFSSSSNFVNDEVAMVSAIPVLEEIETADWVIFTTSVGTLSGFPYGSIEHYFENEKSSDNERKELKRVFQDYFGLEKSTDQIANHILKSKPVFFKTADGNFISVAPGNVNQVRANNTNSSTWENLRVIPLPEGKCLIKDHTGNFLTADVGSNQEIISFTTIPNGWEIFKMDTLANGGVTLLADNGKYVSVNNDSGVLYANQSEVDASCIFHLE